MVIKVVIVRLPILASRSGFTAWGVDLAKKSNITMISRLREELLQFCQAMKE